MQEQSQPGGRGGGDRRGKWAECWAGAEENLSLHAPRKTELELREGQAHFYWSESWQPVAWCQRVEEKAVQGPRIGFVVESRERGEITSKGKLSQKLRSGRYVRFLLQPSDSRECGWSGHFPEFYERQILFNPLTCFLVGLLRTELGEFPRVPSILSSVQL